jgi:succinate-semialdehyde dehydrogenase/glutarate-semialdehyde dehydrogenase
LPTITTVNPATGAAIQSYPRMTDEAMRDAIEACHAAFERWRLKSLEARAAIIARIGESLAKREEELAALMTAEMGKLREQSRQEIELCAAICRYTAETGPQELATQEREIDGAARALVVHAPLGVIYGIQPWNFPAYQVIRYAIANLMAGNGVLLKHAESVTGTGLLLQEIFEESGLPHNLFRPLVISHEQSDAVIAHPRVRGVTLTGSTRAGAHVAAKAGAEVKKTVLELGSNDAYIVLEDADLDHAVRTCVTGRVYNNGEVCIAAKRFIVVDAIYDAFRDRFVEAMAGLRMGDPTQDDVDIGPMAREDLRETLHEQVCDSVEQGAKALCGGAIPEGPGAFYPATVLDEVAPGQPAYDDELFGPVAALIRASDEDDAIRIANDSRFGLGGGVLSGDADRAVALAADRFDTGMVFVNGFGLATPGMPFGGVKQSGYGREHGGFGMKEFVNVKAITVQG